MTRWFLTFIYVILLSACTKANTTSQQEVHNIEPQDVAAYLAEFEKEIKKARVIIGDKSYPLTFIGIGEEHIFVSFAQGLLVLGFDYNQEQALANIHWYKGETSEPLSLIESAEKELVAEQVKVTQVEDTSVYEGVLVDAEASESAAINVTVNYALMGAGNTRLQIKDNRAHLYGTLGTTFYMQLQALLKDHTEVDTLVFDDVQGSMNDDINLHSARLFRESKLTALMPANGQAYSGGVDLYLAGHKRLYEDGGILGVHSWCCVDGKSAHELPESHEEHGAQLTFVRQMLGPQLGPEFYFFTLNAAPAEGMYDMQKSEIIKYFQQPNPVDE